MSHIVILVHKYWPFEKSVYFLNWFAKIWRRKGLKVTVIRGPGPFVEADLAILHIDLTEIPADYRSFVNQYPLVLNGQIKNISKRHISPNILQRKSSYQGSVIVKTNRNYGGMSEALLAQNGTFFQKRISVLRNKLPWALRSYLSISDYQIFDSVKEVPRAVWFNRNLIVEKFIPERHDGHYCLRTWIFLGDRDLGLTSYSDQPIVKSSNVLRREIVSEVPEELRQIRQKLGFDFGKFDYVMNDGRVVLYDANWTPALGALQSKEFLPKIQNLAEGIRAYL